MSEAWSSVRRCRFFLLCWKKDCKGKYCNKNKIFRNIPFMDTSTHGDQINQAYTNFVVFEAPHWNYSDVILKWWSQKSINPKSLFRHSNMAFNTGQLMSLHIMPFALWAVHGHGAEIVFDHGSFPASCNVFSRPPEGTTDTTHWKLVQCVAFNVLEANLFLFPFFSPRHTHIHTHTHTHTRSYTKS